MVGWLLYDCDVWDSALFLSISALYSLLPPALQVEIDIFVRRYLMNDRTHPDSQRVKTAYDRFDKREAESVSLLPEDATYAKRLKEYLKRRQVEEASKRDASTLQ